jgi:hypothetical protein
LSDGTPIRPLANFKATYVLSKDTHGNVVINYQADCKKEEGKSLRANKMQESFENVAISDDAKMQITATVTIAPDGEWSISNPYVYAEFWNNPVEK